MHAATGVAPTEQEMIDWGWGVVSDEEFSAAAKSAGYVSSQQDARVLMGQEKLDVFMVVDIVRFVNPDEAAEDEKNSKEESGDRR